MFKKGAVRLGANEASYGPAPAVRQAIVAEIGSVQLYPFPAGSLEADLAAHLGLSPGNVLLGAGSNDIINTIVTSLGGPANEIVLPEPSFPLYEVSARATGATCVPVPLTDAGTADLPAMLGAIGPATSLVVVCNPNNPTGGHLDQAAIESFVGSVPAGVVVLLDEAYWEMTSTFGEAHGTEGHGGCAGLVQSHPDLVITRTFSKYYSLAGIRVGYALACHALRDDLAARSGPGMVSRLAIAAASTALDSEAYYRPRAEGVRSERQRIFEATRAMGLSPFPSETNFVTFRRPAAGRVEVPMEAFLDRGFWLRPGESVGLPGQVRMTVGSTEQNDAVLELLADLLASDAA